MTRRNLAHLGALVACLAGCAAPADFEAQAPDGRTLLLRQDGTWRYAPDTGGPHG